jgi:anti-anti-sigma regulatory factor
MSRKKPKDSEGRESSAAPTQGAIPSSPPPNGAPAAAAVFDLPPALTIHRVRELRDALLPHFGAAGLVVAVERVTDVDTAGVQLLLALRQARARGGLALEWRGTSGVLTSATRALGLAGELALTGDA